MKKTIGILYEANFYESSFETGCGGSETWVIQIAKQFEKEGFHVFVFSDIDFWQLSPNGIEYVPLSMFDYKLTHQHFNYFIFTRNIGKYYDKLVESGCADKIYVQSHDMFIWKDGIYNQQFNYELDNERFSKINKFIALTNFHKEELHNLNKIPYEKIEVIGNGLDSDVYDNIMKYYEEPNYEENEFFKIFWTSAWGRGGDILVEDIMPLVHKELPFAKVYICGYSDGVPEYIKNLDYVEFLGTLSKEDYYKKFLECHVWFLPCVVVEDFGICAAEACMCNCDIISPYKHGMADVLYPFTGAKMIRSFGKAITDRYHYGTYNIDKTTDNYKRACMEAASLIIERCQFYGNGKSKADREVKKKFVLETYTWEKVVKLWKYIFNE